MFWQERHSQPIQQGIQPSLDLQDHLNKVNKDQSQGKILIFKFSLIFVKGSCWEGYLGHKIIGSLQMRVSKKQINKNPLRQQLKVMPLLVVNHSEIIIITNWEHQKKRIMFNHGTLCSFSGIWTTFWISFWSLSEDCLVLSTTNQSFLTLMPHKNSATSREEPCRLQKVYRYIQSSFRNCKFPVNYQYFYFYKTHFCQNTYAPHFDSKTLIVWY